MDEPKRLRASVKALLALEFDTLLTGDGEQILQEAKARLKDLVGSFSE
jgi:hypothetical protein